MEMNDKKHKESLPIDPHDLKMVTAGTTPRDLARTAIYSVDALMRDHYFSSRTRLMNNLDPVIVVQYSFTGGIFTLINEGTRETVSPVGPNFELCKSIAHIPLGIFSMLSPFLNGTSPEVWQNDVINFKKIIVHALDQLVAAELPPEAEKSCRTIIDASVVFLDKTIKDKSFSIETFQLYTSPIQDAIQVNMKTAVKAMIDGVLPLLRRWKGQLGEDKWRKLYTVVMSIWTTQERNQNWLLVKSMMDPNNVDSHLITISTATPEENTVSVALENLARIVQDNIAASMVFSGGTKFSSDHATALVGPDDLLAITIEEMLMNGCPHSKT